MTEQAEAAYPGQLEHQHGLNEWWPMLPERSAETVEAGAVPPERLYRCQAVGCGALVRVPGAEVGVETAEAATRA